MRTHDSLRYGQASSATRVGRTGWNCSATRSAGNPTLNMPLISAYIVFTAWASLSISRCQAGTPRACATPSAAPIVAISLPKTAPSR
jgi:hypothetical protein